MGLFGNQMGGGFLARLLIGAVFVAFALLKYYSTTQINEITGQKQHISMTPDQEIALGLHSAPQMASQFGGLYEDDKTQNLVKTVGNKLVQSTIVKNTPYQYDFHVLADPETVNAFALPGGQVFITVGLLKRLQNEDQLAGVLGHEIGHVVARHSAERMAKEELTQGLTSAAVVAAGDYNSAQMAQVIGNLINMKYGRDQELQSDILGVRFMIDSGYDPEQMIGVMEILKQASGGQSRDEFTSTHPSPENREAKIREAIDQYKSQKSKAE